MGHGAGSALAAPALGALRVDSSGAPVGWPQGVQPSLLAQRRSGEKEHPRGQAPQHFLNFLWLQGVRSLPPQLSSAPARSAEAWTAWARFMPEGSRQLQNGSARNHPARFLPSTAVCQHRRLQAWGRAAETKRLAGARRPRVGCWAPPRAGPSRAVHAAPGLPVFSLRLQVSNLHICRHGLELRFTPGSACC